MLGSWPSFDPHNFSQFKPNDPSNPSVIPAQFGRLRVATREVSNLVFVEGHRYNNDSFASTWFHKGGKDCWLVRHHNDGSVIYTTREKMTPVTYHPTHGHTLPPPDQVIAPEAKNILLRHFYQHADEKLSSKRAPSDNPTPERASKLARASVSDNV